MRTLCLVVILSIGASGVGAPIGAEVQSEVASEAAAFDETVVVTATLSAEEVVHVPASVEVIDAEEIEIRQATSVAELLSTVAGLNVARSGSAGQSASLFTRGTESDHTLVLWNGIELNDPYFGGFNWAFQPVDGLERVEIVRGPFSALYGSDALGGVVQMISGSRDGVGVRIEGGENGYLRSALDAGAELGPVRLDVAGHVRRGDGELENDFYDSDEVVAHLGWQPSAAWDVGLIARVNDSATGIPLSGGAPSPERRIAWQEREVGLPLRWQRARWQVDARLSRVEYESRFRDPGDPFGFTASDRDSESVRARVAASRRTGDGHWIAAGADYETLEVADRSVFGVNLEGSDQSTTGIFAEWHREWRRQTGGWVLDLGVRYDDNDVYGSEASPRLSMSRRFGAHRLYASYGESFRAPSIGELFFPLSGNPELDPETGRSTELGYVLTGERWGGRLVGFENRLDDLIDFDFLTFTNVNVDRARTRGLEVAVSYDRDAWSIRWNATYLEAEDRGSGLDLLRRPQESSNLVVAWRPERWQLSLVGRYVGARDDLNPITFARAPNASFVTVDLAARWRWTERFAPYARIENLADRDYAEVLGFPSPGRALIGGVGLRY